MHGNILYSIIRNKTLKKQAGLPKTLSGLPDREDMGMKRKISAILAVVLAFSVSLSTYAANSDDPGQIWSFLDEEETRPEEDGSMPTENDLTEAGTEADASTEEEISTETENPPESTDSTETTGSGEEDIVWGEGVIPGRDVMPDADSVHNSEGTPVTSSRTDLILDTEGTGTPEDNFSNGQESLSDVGQVDVILGAALILEKPVAFSVVLSDGAGTDRSETITIGGTSAEEGRASFEGLKEGEYTLTLKAAGFADYTQSIKVEKKAYAVKLMTGFLGGITYEPGGLHPGVLLIGDVNGDGAVDDSDRAALVDAVDGNSDSETADLNGDGAVNLVDLEYFTKGYQETRDTLAKIEKFVPAAVISATTSDGTKVEGDLSELLRNRSSVKLMPENGEISESNPVSIEFNFSDMEETTSIDGIRFETGGDNPVSRAVVTVAYTDENGVDREIGIPVDEVQYLLKNSEEVRVEQDDDGSIEIHLGSQVAVKKVTITITGMQNNNNLAEISEVEFVNGMEERIPEPEMDIPQNLIAEAGSKLISLSWDPCVNVTGYEVLIKQGDLQETVLVAKNAYEVTSFGEKELENYKEYQIRVQSVNGTWRSGYGDEVTAVPKPSKKPDKPDNVSAVGKYKSIAVSWKKMKDTLYYNLYYKESGEETYQKIEKIEENSYTISDLKDVTEYTLYVTGVNELGESGPSLSCIVSTADLNPAVVTKYNLINTGVKGEAAAHIISASAGGEMKDSPLDTASGTAWGTVDNDPLSYYFKNTWDDGGFNNLGKNGLIYEFDQAYKMDTIALLELAPQTYSYAYAKVRYWDENGTATDLGNVSVSRKLDAEERPYYVLKFPEPVTAKKIQFGLARSLAAGTITVTEVYFYHYDTLMDEIMSLYEDDLHTVLKSDVTQETIDALRVKVNTIDEVSGEYHPDRELLERELQTAEAILREEGLGASVEIHNTISTNDVGRGFGGINAWQPLGVSAAAEEEIMIYVGHNTKKTGENTNLQLVATQYHSESSPMFKAVATLKVGANKITIPKIWTTGGFESGGALYVQYTGNNANDRYAVRVSGGAAVPKLDLYRVTDEAERLAKTVAYVEELQTYVGGMETLHEELHKNSGNKQVAYDYDARNCILGASDIMLDTMMFSLPAAQILNGAGSGTAEEKAQRILSSMNAMEDMMYLFYQHKGLNQNADSALNQIPKGHLNIRYQRMFSGAFMYASGAHIGIEWPETAGMMGAVPVTADSDGRYVSGRYFGWGVAHEIGHCINQGAYAVAEVTNNYFAQLAQAKDTNAGMRFQYSNIYEKVTSGTKGRASNGATQLGMYWQLHLAYDKGYNFKTYENYNEQLANLFYARVDTYARDTKKAPAPGGVALTLSNTDQNLMRLSCAAAEKNILSFFERWGMTPDEDTRAYAAQFAKETRAIYYVSDDSRVYTLQGGTSVLGTDGKVEAVADDVRAVINENAANQVDFTLGSKNIPEEDILGYEIVRCTISGGKVVRETAGFATEETFSDQISTMNNRMVYYEITLVDKYLNRSAVKTLEALKIEHDGSFLKNFWTVDTKNLTAVDTAEPGTGNEDSPCSPETENPAKHVFDHDVNTVYKAIAGENPEVVMEFNKTLTVTGFKYTAGAERAAGGYEILLRSGSTWETVAEGNFGGDKVTTIFFANEDGKYVSTYEADAVKLILTGVNGSEVSIAELDVLGVTGDNVDFRQTEGGTPAIGVLAEAYSYGDRKEDVIPAGSIIFTGSYKGNPAYNVVLLYDQDGKIVGGTDADGALKAQQIILADVPDGGMIQNVSEGTWIYWIEPTQQTTINGLKKVRAELYRVNNALTNEGQRLVSDSLFKTMPETLPEIHLTGGGNQ